MSKSLRREQSASLAFANPLKHDLNAAEQDKVVSVTRIRRAQRVFEALEADIEHVFHIAIQIPVRPEVNRLGAIRLRRAIGDLQVGKAELQLPGTPARLCRRVAE